MEKVGTHFHHYNFHLHIHWQIHFRLETPHHGNQQVKSRQQVFAVDNWRTGGTMTETWEEEEDEETAWVEKAEGEDCPLNNQRQNTTGIL